MQMSTPLRNLMRDAYAQLIAENATLDIRTGAPPGVGSGVGGVLLASILIPSSPTSLSAGQVALSGVWQDLIANASGTAGHYRFTNGTLIEEGTVGLTGSGQDMELDSISITAGQQVIITAFTTNMPGA